MNIYTKHPMLFKSLLVFILSCDTVLSSVFWLSSLLSQVDFNFNSKQASFFPNLSLLPSWLLFVSSVMLPIYGMLSDRLGRRRLLLSSMILLTVASLGMLWDQRPKVTAILYAFQALGAATGNGLGYASIADLYGKQKTGHCLLNIFPIMGVFTGIIIALIFLGFYKGLEWRIYFLLAAGFSSIVLLLSYKFLPETYPLKKDSLSSWRQIKDHYRPLLNPRGFWHYMLMPCLVWTTYIFIAHSPVAMLAYIIGSMLAKRHMKKYGLDHTLSFGFWIFLLSIVAVLLIPEFASYPVSVFLILIPVFTLGLAMAFLLPLGVASALTYHPEHRALASGLMSILSVGAATLASSIAKVYLSQAELFWLIVLGLTGVFGLLYYLTRPKSNS